MKRIISLILAVSMLLSITIFATNESLPGEIIEIAGQTYYSEFNTVFSLTMHTTSDNKVYAYYKISDSINYYTYITAGTSADFSQLRNKILNGEVVSANIKSISSPIIPASISPASINSKHEEFIEEKLIDEFGEPYTNILISRVFSSDNLEARLLESLNWNISKVLLVNVNGNMSISEVALLLGLSTASIHSLFNWQTLVGGALVILEDCVAGEYSIKVMNDKLVRVEGQYAYSAANNTFCTSYVGNAGASLNIDSVFKNDDWGDNTALIEKGFSNYRKYST